MAYKKSIEETILQYGKEKSTEEPAQQYNEEEIKAEPIGKIDPSMLKIRRPLQLRIICFLLVLAAFIHLLIVFGILKEEGIPIMFSVYFDSLLVIDVVAAIGLWNFEKWGWYLVMYIAITQIFTHFYLLLFYFQVNQVLDRLIDIAAVLYFIYYFSKYEVREIYLT